MSIFAGDNGIKIFEGFNIFLSNARNPIQPHDADGFLIIETSTNGTVVNGVLVQPAIKITQVLFKVETVITEEILQLLDECKLALKIAIKVNEVTNLTYFGSMRVNVKNVAIATGYNNEFNQYDIPRLS